MNTRLLRRIQRYILEEPKRIDMEFFLTREIEGYCPTYPPCGTVGCIACWACILTLGGDFSDNFNTDDIAAEKIGLSAVQRDNLFFDPRWPQEFQFRLAETKPQTAEYARVVSDRIEHFIKTKGRE